MYPSVFGIGLATAIWLLPAQGQAQPASQLTPPPPPVIIPKVELSEDEKPPAPKARPIEKVDVTPPALLELQQKLRDHPGQRRAGQRVCEAEWGILLGRSNYLPRLNGSLSGGNKWIDQTSGADEYGGSRSSEYDGRGLNATLTMRQHLYDWGRNKAVIHSYRQDRHIAEIERQNTLNEQLATLLRMALQYVLQVRLVDHFADTKQLTDRDVRSMEERFKAGAARLAEMRQARLVGLEIDSRLTQAERQRDLVVQAMKTQFGVNPQQAETYVQGFVSHRPDVPEAVPGLTSPRGRLIRHNIDKSRADYNRLKAERLPAFNGVVTARGWDVGQKHRCNDLVVSGHPDSGSSVRVDGQFVRDGDNNILYRRDQNCLSYEVTGAIEFSVPLYDGGANAAQRGGVEARRIGLEAELAAHQRSHDAESRRLQDQLLDELTQLAEQRQKLDELETQIASERLLSTRTRGNLLNILSLEQRLADERARFIGLTLRAEGTRLEALQLAGALAHVMTISAGESGC